MKHKQFTFEKIDILDEEELNKVSSFLGDGYGGYQFNDIFDKLLPQGYSLTFIKELFSNRHLCMMDKKDSFDKILKKYKETPISEFDTINCPTCDHCTGHIRKDYKRIGRLLNKKGKFIKQVKW